MCQLCLLDKLNPPRWKYLSLCPHTPPVSLLPMFTSYEHLRYHVLFKLITCCLFILLLFSLFIYLFLFILGIYLFIYFCIVVFILFFFGGGVVVIHIKE